MDLLVHVERQVIMTAGVLAARTGGLPAAKGLETRAHACPPKGDCGVRRVAHRTRRVSPERSVGGCLARSWPQATERHVEGVGLRRFPGSIGGAGVGWLYELKG